MIVNHILTEELRIGLLDNLWNKKEEISSVDEQEAILLIELFKSINASRQKIKRIGSIIRPSSLELDYYDKLWTVLRKTKHNSAVTLLAEFISELHVCY